MRATRRYQHLAGFLLLAISLLSAPVSSESSQTVQRPHPRAYSSHVYYVLETRGQSGKSPEELARAVGAELVERVGQLEDHWLIRAEKGLVARGYDASRPIARGLAEGVGERDAVLERFTALRSRATPLYPRSGSRVGDLAERDAAAAIISLQRQHLRLRAKRDRVYYPRQVDIGSEVVSTSLSSVAAASFGINDPIWSKQWHLVNDEIPENAVNATGVWASGLTGKGIKVAIVDDGLDMHSDDLAPNFYPEGSWDYNDHTELPEPRLSDDQHGTRCAGEIAAAKNDVCGIGVAYEAQVAGIRILSAAISDADEASALNYAYQDNDIYSCSWGPPDDGRSMEAPSRLIFKAILNGVQRGRGGRGSVFVFASGNGAAADDQCNFDGYTNSIYSITVSAIDRKGLHPYYSEVCSANMVVTYSSGSGDNIHTTDVGKNKCTDRHGGTSAAAPLAAGIFALALQARPELTWRDMQHLAVNTAVQVLPDDPDWQRTAAGRLYNHKFGFGKLDAWSIVEAAKTWQLVKPQAWYISPNVAINGPVTAEGAVAVIEITREALDAANFERLEHITVAVNIQHKRRGNVEVVLTSPHGMESVLARRRRYDDASSGFPGWVFMSVKHWGEDPVGKWTLRVYDQQQEEGKDGVFENWAMGLWGECKDPAKQDLFKMPDDAQIHLPPSPTVTATKPIPTIPGASAPEEAAPVRPTKPAPLNPPPAVTDSDIQTHKTKTIAKPTDHLPSDHASNNMVASATSSAGPTTSPEGLPEDMAYWGGMSGLLRQTSSWVFVVAGGIIIITGGGIALYLLRRRRQQSDGARPSGYQFEPVAGDEDMPMGSLESGGQLRLAAARRGKGRTTKDLYDAFGVGSDSEDGDGRGEHEKVPLRSERNADHYMDSFLVDDGNGENPLSAAARDQDSPDSSPRLRAERGTSDNALGMLRHQAEPEPLFELEGKP